MNWKPSGDYASVYDAILTRSGQSEEELLFPRSSPGETIEHMMDAAQTIQNALQGGVPIAIVGDYDADGVTATAILTRLLRFLGGDPVTVIPKRFTGGYGLNPDIVASLPEGALLLTVDNGISAFQPIEEAKRRGHTVVVLDHHLPEGESVPKADVLVDPHVHPEKNGFRYYCGAGLAYKLSQVMGPDFPQWLKNELLTLACIGTVADCVPLIGDNRRIVMDGLGVINDQRIRLSPGLSSILATARGEGPITAQTIGHKIGPLLNAPGRLYNAGGTSVLKALLSDSSPDSVVYQQKMVEINERRKALVKRWEETIQTQLEEQGDLTPPIFYYHPQIPEGLGGIIAGRLAERYHMPAFVFAQSHDGTAFKGSGRSFGDYDIKKMLDSMKDFFTVYGGHVSAVGLTIPEKTGLEPVKAAMETYMAGFVPDDTLVYDLEVAQDELPAAFLTLQQFEPYGEGVPKPLVRVKPFRSRKVRGSCYLLMGGEKDHFRLNGAGCNAIGFFLAKNFEDYGFPERIDLVGSLESNTFRGVTSPQLLIEDFVPAGE